MIKFFSTRTGQSIGAVSLRTGEVSLDPASMRAVMKTLADSNVGHLVDFTFGEKTVAADCLFGAKAVKDINLQSSKRERLEGEPSDFTPL